MLVEKAHLSKGRVAKPPVYGETYDSGVASSGQRNA